MFNLGWTELVLIGAVTILVVGPKELPGMLRTAGQMLGKLRRLSNDFKGQIDEAIEADEMKKLREEIDELKKDNPMADLKGQLEDQFNVDPITESEKNKEAEDWDNAIEQVSGVSGTEQVESNVTPLPERSDQEISKEEKISETKTGETVPGGKTREA